ncbi:hypothetical protein, partial [Microcoleus sp. AT3-D2]|uniref:hypothetical protein n=1 Tax=Microcoleus sp. AT3-D2 TaxID=2818612 RepID=UPI002FD317C4
PIADTQKIVPQSGLIGLVGAGLLIFTSSIPRTKKPAPTHRRYSKNCSAIRVNWFGGGGFINILDVNQRLLVNPPLRDLVIQG